LLTKVGYGRVLKVSKISFNRWSNIFTIFTIIKKLRNRLLLLIIDILGVKKGICNDVKTSPFSIKKALQNKLKGFIF
jgi:hypothetical protein